MRIECDILSCSDCEEDELLPNAVGDDERTDTGDDAGTDENTENGKNEERVVRRAGVLIARADVVGVLLLVDDDDGAVVVIIDEWIARQRLGEAEIGRGSLALLLVLRRVIRVDVREA